MSDCYVGEIRMFGGSYAPQGWALCAGQTMSISQYDQLYALIGTTYGGDGVTTFKLPDLQGRVPLHRGQGPGLTNRTIGAAFGMETVTLQVANIPAHTHSIVVGGDATTADPTNGYLGNSVGFNLYSSAASPDNTMSPSAVGQSGQNAALSHDNMMPGLCINFIIALAGQFPSQN